MARLAALVLRAPALHPLIAALLRYAFVGGLVSGLSTVTYLVPAVLLGVPPLIANFISYLFAVCTGYVLHRRFSFPNDDPRVPPGERGVRFFLVSLVSLALNSLFVWLITGPMGLSPWWPLPAMLFATPLVTFYLNRKWVFC